MGEDNLQHASEGFGHFTDTIWRPFTKSPARSYALFSFFLVLLVGTLFCTRFLDSGTLFATNFPRHQKLNATTTTKIECPLNCSALNLTATSVTSGDPAPSTCPAYFRWIYEDLRPWARTGITLDMVERAQPKANFRLVVLDGKAYIEKYHGAFQTRDIFSMWGFLQLLRRYPGKIPDLDLMFNCDDLPVIKSKDFNASDEPVPPPLFQYCSDDESLDIVFPDWSFWGWPEINIKPWKPLLEDLKEGNKRTKWIKREPYAYWKGNPYVSEARKELLKCNVSKEHDWNARVYALDWIKEIHEGFKTSNLADQCTHRYKIFIEGVSWSVSQKYILSCDSVTLLVKPRYYDFFTRGLMPMQHYWPIKENDKCRSLKFAVHWGNSNQQKAQAIGKAASEFIQRELNMNYVYDYMFHLLNEYSKLLTYKPTIPKKALEFCSEVMACKAEGLKKKFLMESMVTTPSNTSPCAMPPPFDPASIHGIIMSKEKSISEVELWQKNFWENQTREGTNKGG